MSTTRAVFTPYGAEFPSTNFPQLEHIHSTARRPVLSFDPTTDESCYWTDVAPVAFTGPINAVISYCMRTATSGSVRFQAQIEAVSDGDSTDLDASESLDTADSVGSTVPGTAGFMKQATIAMTHVDSMVAGDMYRFKLTRDADGTSGTDDATGDCHVISVELQDAA